jgi:hypothetical protein
MYPQFAQKAQKILGLPQVPPFDPSHVENIAKMIDALDGGQRGAQGVQGTYIDAQGNRVAIMRDGSTQILGQNAPNNQIIAGEGGFYGVNKGNLQAAPVMMGGPQAPQQPASTFALDDAALQSLGQLPPQERAAALQAMMTGGDFHVGEGGQPVQGLSPGMQLRPAPKPPAATSASELEKRVAMARQMGATPEQIKAMVVGGGQTGNAQAVKTSQGTSVKMAQLGTIQRQIDRLEQASNSLAENKVFDGGPLDQYAVKFGAQGQELEQAGAAILPVLTALTRVPGIGAQSDLESRLQKLQLPDASMHPAVRQAAIKALREYMADLQKAYETLNRPAGQPAAPSGGWSIQAVP